VVSKRKEIGRDNEEFIKMIKPPSEEEVKRAAELLQLNSCPSENPTSGFPIHPAPRSAIQ